jgi:hypothetical protein
MGRWTLRVAVQDILFREALIKPGKAPGDEIEVETLDRYTHPLGEHEHT